jgi:hypothetical protein
VKRLSESCGRRCGQSRDERLVLRGWAVSQVPAWAGGWGEGSGTTPVTVRRLYRVAVVLDYVGSLTRVLDLSRVGAGVAQPRHQVGSHAALRRRVACVCRRVWSARRPGRLRVERRGRTCAPAVVAQRLMAPLSPSPTGTVLVGASVGRSCMT